MLVFCLTGPVICISRLHIFNILFALSVLESCPALLIFSNCPFCLHWQIVQCSLNHIVLKIAVAVITFLLKISIVDMYVHKDCDFSVMCALLCMWNNYSIYIQLHILWLYRHMAHAKILLPVIRFTSHSFSISIACYFGYDIDQDFLKVNNKGVWCFHTLTFYLHV